jgi:ribonuclease HI
MPTPALKLFFDGGCRPNPGAMESAVVARGVTYYQRDIGHGDNSEAEWHAAIHALGVARMLGADNVILVGDSALVVGQAAGSARCRSAVLGAHLATFTELAVTFTRVRMRRVGRHQNLAGIALDRLRRQ